MSDEMAKILIESNLIMAHIMVVNLVYANTEPSFLKDKTNIAIDILEDIDRIGKELTNIGKKTQ